MKSTKMLKVKADHVVSKKKLYDGNDAPERSIPKPESKLRKGFSRNKNQNRHNSITSPNCKKEPKTTITDSDSKRFFDEIFDDPTDLDQMLRDTPDDMDFIDEAAEHLDDH